MERSPQWLPPQPPAGGWEPATQPVSPPASSPPPYEEQRPSLLRRLLAPLILVGALLLNYGVKLKFLLVALKGAKFLTTSATMLVSIGAYALFWGWRFAVGIVTLLLVHELGHYIQMRREGLKPSAIVFVPFLGAAISAKSLGGDAVAEARVGLAGPILGSIGAAAVAVAGVATGSDLLLALAFTGFFLNLFNLLPVTPLDGGRAMAALAPWMWFVGLGVVFLLVFMWPNPILILIALLGAFDVYHRWKRKRQGGEASQAYYRVRPRHRLAVGAVYAGLIVLLALGMDATFVERSIQDV